LVTETDTARFRSTEATLWQSGRVAWFVRVVSRSSLDSPPLTQRLRRRASAAHRTWRRSAFEAVIVQACPITKSS